MNRCQRRSFIRDIAFFLLGFVVLFSVTHCQPVPAETIPASAQQHRALLVRSVHAYAGLDAPVATFAAQVHQESRWRTDASSPVGAQGIAQFMPGTSQWIAQVNPALQNPQPYNPGWALRALVIYDEYLIKQNQASDPCNAWAMTLAAYNGGQGWVNRDRKLALASGANGLVWFNQIELFNSGRSASNFNENRHYPKAILFQWETLYEEAGWGFGVCDQQYKF